MTAPQTVTTSKRGEFVNDEREQARRRERYVHLEAIRARAREMGEAAHRMQEVAEARQARIVAAAKRQRR